MMMETQMYTDDRPHNIDIQMNNRTGQACTVQLFEKNPRQSKKIPSLTTTPPLCLPPPPFPRPQSGKKEKESMKLGSHVSIPNSIDLELEDETGRVDGHVEGEVEVVELDAARRSEAGKERLGHGAEVGRQGADGDEALAEGVGRDVGVAGDEVVFDDERLARTEVARVVEGYGGAFGDLGALIFVGGGGNC